MAGELAYNVYDSHIVRTGGAELYHKPPSAHTHLWDHQWNAAGYDTITFTGTRIRIYAVTYSQYGIATVALDGGAATDVDLYTPNSVACTVPVWDSGVLTNGAHTVVWSWSGRKNAAADTATCTVVLDWFDITPPPLENLLVAGNFGVLTGQTWAVTGGYAAQVRYSADARNYLDFIVNIRDTGDSTVTINAVLNGVSTIGGDTTWAAPYLVTLPTGLAQAYIKVVAREAGNYKMFEVWVAPSASPTAWVLYLSLPLFALMGTNQWSTPYSLGSGYEWTDVAAAAAIVPSPPTTAWYAKNFETSLDGAYGRVTMLGTDGLPTTIYSNGVDGNDSLVSVDTTEYFDPTSALAQVNSCRFSIHTPFTKETPQTTIAAFLATFAQDQPFEVERGWMTATDGDEDYDIVTMGRFFVTDAALDKNQWIVNVEAQDGMGLLLDARYLNSPYGLITPPYANEDYIPLPPGDEYVPIPEPTEEDDVLFFDDFNRADGALGVNWNTDAGVSISGNKVVGTSGGAVAQTEPFTDCRASVTVISPSDPDRVYLILRLQSPLAAYVSDDGYDVYDVFDNGYTMWLDNSGLMVWCFGSGTRQIIPWTACSEPLIDGDVISFQADGNVFTVYKNGALLASGTDGTNEFTSGYAGFSMDDGSRAIDDFLVETAS